MYIVQLIGIFLYSFYTTWGRPVCVSSPLPPGIPNLPDVHKGGYTADLQSLEAGQRLLIFTSRPSFFALFFRASSYSSDALTIFMFPLFSPSFFALFFQPPHIFTHTLPLSFVHHHSSLILILGGYILFSIFQSVRFSFNVLYFYFLFSHLPYFLIPDLLYT